MHIRTHVPHNLNFAARAVKFDLNESKVLLVGINLCSSMYVYMEPTICRYSNFEGTIKLLINVYKSKTL
jgi:hypothetical protein